MITIEGMMFAWAQTKSRLQPYGSVLGEERDLAEVLARAHGVPMRAVVDLDLATH